MSYNSQPRGTNVFDSSRIDFDFIAEMIAPGSRVLDVGCGDGELLERLVKQRGVDGRGMELSQEGVNASVSRGLSVIQGDADTDLRDYPEDAFDYVILSQTIQATHNPSVVLKELSRIGRHIIVSFPNFGHWRVRLKLLLQGRMPETPSLGFHWYDTPNIHLCTLRDFADLSEKLDLRIDDALAVRSGGAKRIGKPGPIDNLTANEAVFLLSRKD